VTTTLACAPFAEYAAAGFGSYLLPIIPPDAKLAESSMVADNQRGKVPGTRKSDGTWVGFPKWTARPTPTDDELARWARWGAGLGFILAPPDAPPLCAVDADITDPALSQAVRGAVEGVLGPGLVRIGRHPKALLLYAIDGPAPAKDRVVFTIPGRDDEQAVELLCRGQQFVAEGIHPKTGAPYVWEGLDPTMLGLDGLTKVTPEQVRDAMAAAVAVIIAHGGVVKARVSGDGTDHDRMRVGDPSLLAPNLDAVRDALAQLPNEDLHEEDWFKMLVAVKAATAFAGPDDGWEVFEDWSAQSGKHDERARARWDAVDDAAIGWPQLLGMARNASPGFGAGFDFKVLPPSNKHAPTPRQIPEDFDPTKIKTRPWVLGNRMLRGAVTGGIGAPGVSKSTMQILSALAIITGREDLTGEKVHMRGPVWIHNNEDDETEMLRRIAGICRQFKIDFADVRPHLHFSSGAVQRLVVARKVGDEVKAEAAVQEIIDTCVDLGVIALFVDPFVSTHDGVAENSNEEIEKVASCFREIARRANLALEIVHHGQKNNTGNSEARAGDMNLARGAGALIGAVRIAYTIMAMSEKTAEELGIPDHEAARMIRLDMAKGNYSARSWDPIWFRVETVGLGNGPQGVEGDLRAPEDTVGVPVRTVLDSVRTARTDDTDAEALVWARRVLDLMPVKPGTTAARAILPALQATTDRGRSTVLGAIKKHLQNRERVVGEWALDCYPEGSPGNKRIIFSARKVST
jgi:hypothetical protein